jgi:hypothetical protein
LSARPFTSEQNRARTLYAATSAARIGRIPLAVPTAAGSFGSRTESAALTISIKPHRIPLPWTIGELKHSGRRGEELARVVVVPSPSRGQVGSQTATSSTPSLDHNHRQDRPPLLPHHHLLIVSAINEAQRDLSDAAAWIHHGCSPSGVGAHLNAGKNTSIVTVMPRTPCSSVQFDSGDRWELGLRWALSVNAAAVACLVTWSGRRLRVMRERRRTVRRWIEKERRRLE